MLYHFQNYSAVNFNSIVISWLILDKEYFSHAVKFLTWRINIKRLDYLIRHRTEKKTDQTNKHVKVCIINAHLNLI